MAHAGQTLDDPVSGERIVFNATARDTRASTWGSGSSSSPGGKVPGMHVHPEQEDPRGQDAVADGAQADRDRPR
jgi:hypothetical protein